MDGFHAPADRTLHVLGPTVATWRGEAHPCSARERRFLAVLALHHPRSVDVEAVADTLWGDGRPRTYRQVVHNLVSGLRRALGPDTVLTEPGPAYRLGPGWTIDADAFRAEVEQARRARASGNHRAARVHLQRALERARGEAFADLPDVAAAAGRRATHVQAVLAAQEDLVFADLDVGEPLGALARASALVAEEPYREIRWALLALAAYRADQRGAALASLARARTVLREDLGLEPGPTLVRLEHRVLADEAPLLYASARAALGLDEVEPTAAHHGTGTDDGDDVPRQLPVDEAVSDPGAAIESLRSLARGASEAGMFADAAELLTRAVAIADGAFGADDEVALILRLDRGRAAPPRR